MNVQFNLAAEQPSCARKVGMGIAAMAAASFLLAAGGSAALSAATASATGSTHVTVSLDHSVQPEGSCPANRCAL
jgi:hypothetical protein